MFHQAIPALRAGNTTSSVDLIKKSVALARSTQDAWLTAYMLNALGVCLLRGGNPTRARIHFEEALSLARATGDDLMGAYQLSCLGAVARAENDLDRAEAFLSECLTIAVPHADWRLVAQQGRVTPVQKIVDEILESASKPSVRGSRRGGALTARERQVAALVVDGWSNREIAKRLVITERTAENHVSHILDKLAIGSRNQVAGVVAGR